MSNGTLDVLKILWYCHRHFLKVTYQQLLWCLPLMLGNYNDMSNEIFTVKDGADFFVWWHSFKILSLSGRLTIIPYRLHRYVPKSIPVQGLIQTFKLFHLHLLSKNNFHVCNHFASVIPGINNRTPGVSEFSIVTYNKLDAVIAYTWAWLATCSFRKNM